MDPQNPQSSIPVPPQPPPQPQPAQLPPSQPQVGNSPPMQAPGQAQYEYPQQVAQHAPQQVPQQLLEPQGVGWQQAGYQNAYPPQYAYPHAPVRQGFPMWAWGAVGVGALVLLLAGIALVASLAGSRSNSGNLPPVIQQNAQMGPPQWVQPGLRVTFYSAAASVAQSRFAWVEDPTGPWEDPKTGKRYRRTDEDDPNAGIPNQDISTASGDGVSQIDVLAVEGGDIVYSSNLYTIDRGSSPPVFLPPVTSGGKAPGVAVDGAWVHPGLLAQLQEYNQSGVMVLRGNYTVGGTTYQAISFANTSAVGYLQYTYDTQTGLLLSATTSTKGATSPFHAAGQSPPTGNTQLTITRFVGYRTRTLPGTNGVNPGWLANTRELYYTGNYLQTNPVDPSTGAFNYPLEVSVSFGAGGANWAPFTARAQTQGGQPSETSGVTGASGFYWVDPQALASVSPQQQLDRDPFTGETVDVASVDQGTVTFVSRLPGVETSATYSQGSGVLVGYRLSAARTGATLDLRLQRGP